MDFFKKSRGVTIADVFSDRPQQAFAKIGVGHWNGCVAVLKKAWFQHPTASAGGLRHPPYRRANHTLQMSLFPDHVGAENVAGRTGFRQHINNTVGTGKRRT